MGDLIIDGVSGAALVEVTEALRAALDAIPTGRLVLVMESDTSVGRLVRDYIWTL